MKKLFILFAAIAFFSSCKKEDDETCPNANPPSTAITPANNYWKLQVGNYWVYDQYKVDTNGVETLQTTTDSSYVSGDTVWHGNTYYELFDLYYTAWLRDSSGYIVDTTGEIHFTNQVFNIPVAFNYYGGNLGYNESMTMRTPVSVTVPAGTFTAYDWQIEAHFTQPTYPWPTVRYAHDYYSDGIGKVKQVFFYASQPDHYERRLNHYHVQ
ncbi:MAG TPA: hypothetical protein VL651_12125 [Bacteroidia bacterium]|jgi:hypothetical protein|nr:hypothetical protein [Bacteroidia bacterium]